MFKIAHLADVCFGAVVPEVVEATLLDLKSLAPDLVVVSGNLTRRATSDQFEAARAFLDKLPAPRLVVPGPRDAGGVGPFGFLRPLRRYRAMITDELSPFFSAPEIAVLGIDTSRRSGARILPERAGLIRSRLDAPDRVTVLVTHDPLVPRPSRGTTVAASPKSKELHVVAKCVDLVLAGHQAVGSTQDTRVAYRILDRQAIVAQAALAPMASKGGDAAPYYNRITVDGDQVTIAVRLWKRTGFEEQGPKSYRFGDMRWEKYVDMPSDFQWSESDGSDAVE
jgi:3',5'-cyclic AMP phosphodiesterase CpdA